MRRAPASASALTVSDGTASTLTGFDSDYRGEVKVLLVNLGDDDFEVTRGMRVAQIVFAEVTRAGVEERSLSNTTGRGSGGFGSTGTG